MCMWELDAIGQGKVTAFKNEKITKQKEWIPGTSLTYSIGQL